MGSGGPLKLGLLAGVLMAAPVQPAAHAQPAPADAPRVGEKLRDAKGLLLGQIERVIPDADGRPRQVLVRVTRVLRVLPMDGLTPSRDGYVTVLTRAELEALPASP